MQLAQIDFGALFDQQNFDRSKALFAVDIDENLTIGKIISSTVPYLFVIAGLLVLLFLIYGGFQLMLSAGDPKKVQEGQGKITSALVGFVLIFVAYWIVLIVGKVLGISVIGNIFKP